MEGMEAIISALAAGVTTATLFGVVASLAGLTTVGILVGFGMNRLGRTVRGLGRGKAAI